MDILQLKIFQLSFCLEHVIPSDKFAGFAQPSQRHVNHLRNFTKQAKCAKRNSRYGNLRDYCLAGRKESEGGTRGRRRERLPTWRAAGTKAHSPARTGAPRRWQLPAAAYHRAALEVPQTQKGRGPAGRCSARNGPNGPNGPNGRPSPPRLTDGPRAPAAAPRRPGPAAGSGLTSGRPGRGSGGAAGQPGEPRAAPTCPSPPRRASVSARPATGPPSCRGAQRGDAASEPRT